MVGNMNLPTNTTDRLLAVAQIIDEQPQRWDQDTWTSDPGKHGPRAVQADHECGTTSCVAGWAVRLTPLDESLPNDWQCAGAVALGIEDWCDIDTETEGQCLSDWVFGWLENDHPVSDILRVIATFPEGERTFDKVVPACIEKGLVSDS